MDEVSAARPPEGMVTINQLVDKLGGYYGAFLNYYRSGKLTGWQDPALGVRSTIYMDPEVVMQTINEKGLKIKGLKQDMTQTERKVDEVLQRCWNQAKLAALEVIDAVIFQLNQGLIQNNEVTGLVLALKAERKRMEEL